MSYRPRLSICYIYMLCLLISLFVYHENGGFMLVVSQHEEELKIQIAFDKDPPAKCVCHVFPRKWSVNSTRTNKQYIVMQL